MRNNVISRVLHITLALVLILLVFTLGCTGTPATDTTTTASTSTSTNTSNTLKIGAVTWMGWPPGLAAAHGLQTQVDMINDGGGLTIGGEKYNVELIAYDTNNNQATAVAAVNRLIFEDKVKFIVSDGNFGDAWLQISESNKIVVSTASASTELLKPEYYYSFQTAFVNCNTALIEAWCIDKNPNFKTYAGVTSDSEAGHSTAALIEKVFDSFGKAEDLTIEYSPPSVQDLSSIATKIKNLNPDVFQAFSNSDDTIVYKAVYQAGYRGQFIGGMPLTLLQMTLDPEVIEGYIGSTTACGFETPTTDFGKQFKEAYNAKYPNEAVADAAQFSSPMAALKAALLKADSIDSDKVADAFSNGLIYEGPAGTGQMVSRPDMGNNRTIDSILDYNFYKVENGKATMADHLSIEDASKYFYQVYK